MSVNVKLGIQLWRSCRMEFEVVREAAYARALDATNGVLLNRRGIDAGIDTYSLFIGSNVRAYAYASRELIDHWAEYPRLTFEEFERQSFEVES